MDHLNLKLSFGMKMTNAPLFPAAQQILASAKRLLEDYHIAISSRKQYYKADILGAEVTGAFLGIVGMGGIGYEVALRAKAFEMKIFYHNRTQRHHTLLKLKTVIIMPQLGIKTDKTTSTITEEAVENFLTVLNGLSITSEVLSS